MRPLPGRSFLALTILVSACGESYPETQPQRDFAFLTSQDCPNAAVMRARLDEALERMGRPPDYMVVDLTTLSETDARRAYPSPTVLYAGRDLFGMPEPRPPYPTPT